MLEEQQIAKTISASTLVFLGPYHPEVAIRLNSLGGVLQDLGDLEGARKNFERALEILQRSWARTIQTQSLSVATWSNLNPGDEPIVTLISISVTIFIAGPELKELSYEKGSQGLTGIPQLPGLGKGYRPYAFTGLV